MSTPGFHDAEFGLVLPFVACESAGGPYEDQAFVAGFQAGQLASAMEALRPGQSVEATVVAPLERQVDLIAMWQRCRVEFRVVPVDDGTPAEWATVRAVKLAD